MCIHLHLSRPVRPSDVDVRHAFCRRRFRIVGRRRRRTRRVADYGDDVHVSRQIGEDVRRVVSPLDDVGGFRPVAGVGGHVRETRGSVRRGSGRHGRRSGPLRRTREEGRPPGRAPQDAQADVREGGAVGTQEGVCVRQARVDDGTVCGRFLSARRREDRQLDGQPEGGRGDATTPAQGGRGRRRAEADRVAARVRRPVHGERRGEHRRTAGLGRRRVPSAARLRPHRGGPVERPAIGGRPAYDRRRVRPLVGSARPSRRSRGVP